jgi:hypothetical protein
VPQGHVCRWITLPTPTARGWTGGKVVIDGCSYTTDASIERDDETGCRFMYVKLRRWDGKRIVLCVGQSVETCSCEHATYRQVRCKHIGGMGAALDTLDTIEKELDDAADALNAMPKPDLERPCPASRRQWR